jgi:hypothetical protein
MENITQVPPYAEASALANSLYDHRAQAELLGTLIADAGFGVILVAPAGQIIYMNNVASNLIRLRRGFCSQQGRLKATDVKCSQKLQSLISAASLPATKPSLGQ